MRRFEPVVRRFEPVSAVGGGLLLIALFEPWYSAIDLWRLARPRRGADRSYRSWMALRDESTPGAVAPEVPRRPAPPSTSP
jgi:hypothetical protein